MFVLYFELRNLLLAAFNERFHNFSMQNKYFHVKIIDLIQKTEVYRFTSLVHKVLLPIQNKGPVNGAGIQ